MSSGPVSTVLWPLWPSLRSVGRSVGGSVGRWVGGLVGLVLMEAVAEGRLSREDVACAVLPYRTAALYQARGRQYSWHRKKVNCQQYGSIQLQIHML